VFRSPVGIWFACVALTTFGFAAGVSDLVLQAVFSVAMVLAGVALPGLTLDGHSLTVWVFAAAVLPSCLFTINPSETYPGVLLVVAYAMSFTLLRKWVGRGGGGAVSRGLTLAYSLITLAAITSVYSLALYALSAGRFPAVRPSGPFPYVNAYAAFLLAPILLGVVIPAGGRRSAGLLWGTLILNAAAFLLASSRGGLYALGLGILAVVAYSPRHARRVGGRLLLGTMAAVVLAGGITLAKPAGDGVGRAGLDLASMARRFSITVPNPGVPGGVGGAGVSGGAGLAAGQPQVRLDPSAAGRLRFWRISWLAIKERPVIGYGLGSFYQVFPAFQDSPGEYTIAAHSFYVQWWLETGVLGLAAAAVMFAYWLWRAIRQRRRASGERRALRAGLFAGMVALLAHMAVDLSFDFIAVAAILFGLAGALAGLDETPAGLDETPAGPADAHPTRRLRAIVAAGLVVVALFWGAAPAVALKLRLDAEKMIDGGRFADASAALSWAKALNPYDGWIYAHSAYLSYLASIASGDPRLMDVAVREVTRGLQRNPWNSFVWGKLARLKWIQGDLEGAEAAFQRAAELFPYWPYHRFDGGAFYLATNRPAEAVRRLEPPVLRPADYVWAIRPDMRDSYARALLDHGFLLALAYHDSGRYGESRTTLTRLLSWNPAAPLLLELNAKLRSLGY
jgi:hypothetical protein